MSAYHDADGSRPGAGGDEWWQCQRCGRPSGIGSTCLVCALGARFDSDPPALRWHAGGSAPAPVVIVQAAVLLIALIAAFTAIHVLFAAAPFTVASLAAGPQARPWLALLEVGLVMEAGYLLALCAGGIWAVNALHRGEPVARLVLSALPVLDLLMIAGTGADPVSRLMLAVHLGIAALLWLPEPTRQHFRFAPATP